MKTIRSVTGAERRLFLSLAALIVLAGLILLIVWLIKPRQEVPAINETPGLPVEDNLAAARLFFNKEMVKGNGHILLYVPLNWTGEEGYNSTNSEALSYYLLWNANLGDKEAFDKALSFVQEKMLQPEHGYLMWRLEANGSVIADGANIASDADLRVIKSLAIANEKWKDPKYIEMSDRLAAVLEEIAVTDDKHLSPYGGSSGKNSVWKTQEVWLSYSDFTAFKALSDARGEPWTTVNKNMKKAAIDSQIWNGLYNSMLTEGRQFGNGIDGNHYSINSMWIMVRSAESSDPMLKESANKSLSFYRKKYQDEGRLVTAYGSDGASLNNDESPWVYALVGRASIALDDKEFSDKMVSELLKFQITHKDSEFYGAIPEGEEEKKRVGQFTMQESILTLYDYIDKWGDKRQLVN